MLASVLDGQVAAEPVSTLITTPTSRNEQASTPAETSTDTTETTVTADTPESTIEIAATLTPAPASTATSRPTQTPTATLGAPYQLVGEDTICEPELAEGLLQVVVIDARRQQIPGAEVIITWNIGEEHIFTGFKPELGYGYADFVMSPDAIYSVRMADGGTPASDLSTPSCTTPEGEPYRGGYLLTFQQP
jgi:hypothetical protein